MTFKEIRDLSGLTRPEFGRKYHIPKRTLESWETSNVKGKRMCPIYVLELLERVVRMDFTGKPM